LIVEDQGRVRAAVVDDVRADAPHDAGTPAVDLSDIVLPGGLRAALAAIKDANSPDRSQFLLEVIRRVHNLGSGPDGSRDATLVALLTHLDTATHGGTAQAPPPAGDAETLPLPLTPAIWVDVVFSGRATAATLVSDILRSRNASLLYAGLLSLDVETRAFLAAQPALLADVSSRLAPMFALASPGLRVADGKVRLPGGEPAAAAWEALVGRRVSEPTEFVRALLAQDDGRAAWFVGALGQLTPAQRHRLLDLEADASARATSMRRLYEVFVRVAADWRMEARTFWRPSYDPTLLAAWLPMDAEGRPLPPGTRLFWQTVFDDTAMAADVAARAGREPPVDFAWLADRVFVGPPADHRRRLQQVLFASRLPPPTDARSLVDTVDAVRSVARYPALVATLERLHVSDAALYAQAARRAADLSSIDGGPRAVRTITQFQGLLAVIARATARGGLDTATAHTLVRGLVVIDRGPRGDYDGRLVEWLEAQLVPHDPNGPLLTLEQRVLRLVAGPAPRDSRVIEWEGSRYRVDVAAAEMRRLERLLGEQSRPWFSSARTLVTLAAAPARPRAADTLADVARRVGWTDAAPDPRAEQMIARYRTVSAALTHGARSANADRRSARLSSTTETLRVLADDLLARGLLELTYAIALGQSDRAWITADEASVGHEFGFGVDGSRRADTAWRRPVAGADQRREWRATGSLLGLEVSLSELGLVRLSTRPPPRRPSINEEDRRSIVETAALVEPAAITDADRDRLVAAMARGRARLAAARTSADAMAIAADLALGAERHSLLAWTVSRDPERVARALSPFELLQLGLVTPHAPAPPRFDSALHAWGATAEASTGCLCLRLASSVPWQALAGRWGSGLFAGAFPDLNLRLAELLATLQMPAELLGPVLAPATLDLANNAVVRGQDDRRSLVEFVQALTPTRVEQYLALLTTGGPLVPLEGADDLTASKPGAPR
jgi:hypothetical protein